MANLTAATPSITGRRRGFSYLRNYAQSHRDNGSQHSSVSAQLAEAQAREGHLSGITKTLSDSHPAELPDADGSIAASRASSQALSTTVAPSLSSPSRLTPIVGLRPHVQSPKRRDVSPITRERDANALPQIEYGDDMAQLRLDAETGHGVGQGSGNEILPSIRFSVFCDPRAKRPSLAFAPVTRTLPTGHEVIRVGRYSERDNQLTLSANEISASPVGFKSKVVSRRHCEFWCEDGKWYIKDVKSSSGTFLNHIRLSPPGTESKPFPINDGDIVQLGIDFKGGEELIFRCVKMRLGLNRGWQKKLNAFNMTNHKRLRNMTKSNELAGSAQSSQDCSICLNSIAPCQSLFVAPCSHTWHYKCIRSLLSSPYYPIFTCPNCRAAADLEAEVEDPEEWQQLDSDDGLDIDSEIHPFEENCATRQDATLTRVQKDHPTLPAHADLLSAGVSETTSPDLSKNEGQYLTQASLMVSHATCDPMPIPSSAGTAARAIANEAILTSSSNRRVRTPSPSTSQILISGSEGPITPRNDAGPWVFDGSGIRTRVSERASSERQDREVRSIDTAAALEIASHLPG